MLSFSKYCQIIKSFSNTVLWIYTLQLKESHGLIVINLLLYHIVITAIVIIQQILSVCQSFPSTVLWY